ncbi:MAG: hypothetical protein RIF41_31625 [Polyangiaceae bacterium]
MRRFTLLTALASLLLVAAPASAEPTKANATRQRRAQVVRMDPIKAHPMKPNAVIEIRKRRMTLPPRGATGFTHRIGQRLGDAPF